MRIILRTDRSCTLRMILLTVGMLVAFLLLGAKLWWLQVEQVSKFESRIQRQSLRRVRLPGIRGKIYDRNGFCLADNRPVYSIALYMDEIRRAGPKSRTIDQATNVIAQVAAITGLTPRVTRHQIEIHMDQRRPLPLILWSDVSPEVMARLAEKGTDIPGVDLYIQTTRTYPYSPATSHLIGYIGRADPDPDAEEENYSYYLPEMTGKNGLELVFDPFLRGEAGGMLIQIDVSGYRQEEVIKEHRAPKVGGDLQLTLDMEVQLLASEALDGCQGAVVVLDPNNGDVLAMLSEPGFDANQMVPYIPSKVWNPLVEDPATPLLNRAVQGTYPPGSIFKPIVGLATITENPEAASVIYDSPAVFKIGGRTVTTTGHGKVDMRDALKYSANVYFFKTALECGPELIFEAAEAVGLGKKTGVEVYSESSGIVPDKHYQQEKKIGWSDGDTCNLAIGQGALTVTPIQMAMMTATIANGGHLYRPRLVKAYREPSAEAYVENPKELVRNMNWSGLALTTVREGMHDVIMSPDGTGRSAAVDGFDFAGKTGTAEYGTKSAGKKQTWMIAFAPFDQPQYAVAMLIEDGVSGGKTVGPQLKILMEGLYAKMKREGGRS